MTHTTFSWGVSRFKCADESSFGARLAASTPVAYLNTLKAIEKEGLIERIEYHQIPPKVEYKLSDIGEKSVNKENRNDRVAYPAVVL